jgi:anti-anti-sigma factor
VITIQNQSIPTIPFSESDKDYQMLSAADSSDSLASEQSSSVGQALAITKENFTDGVLYRLEGDLDIETVSAARRILAPALNGADDRPVVLDLQAVTYIDSMGIGLLAAFYRKTQPEDGALSVALLLAPGSQTWRILELCGFEKAFPIFNSPDELPWDTIGPA